MTPSAASDCRLQRHINCQCSDFTTKLLAHWQAGRRPLSTSKTRNNFKLKHIVLLVVPAYPVESLQTSVPVGDGILQTLRHFKLVSGPSQDLT